MMMNDSRLNLDQNMCLHVPLDLEQICWCYNDYSRSRTVCQHEDLEEISTNELSYLYYSRSRRDCQPIKHEDLEEILCLGFTKKSPRGLTDRSLHATLAKLAKDLTIYQPFMSLSTPLCLLLIDVFAPSRYTEILKDTILIQNSLIYIKVFKTFF